MRILIVDDSVVFRSHIRAALDTVDGFDVVGVASNGKLALERLAQTTVDLVTLDLEMPVMGGLETLAAIKRQWPHVIVVIFASRTADGSAQALAALRAGAADMIAKPDGVFASPAAALAALRQELVPKLQQFGAPKAAPVARPAGSRGGPPRPSWTRVDLATFRPRLVVIASSTGGPSALEAVFSQLRAPLRVPILIAQHMPPMFTQQLAKRLGQICGAEAAEARNGEALAAGRIYVAPGDYHLRVMQNAGNLVAVLDQAPQRNSVRPAADHLFESAAAAVGRDLMAFVFTGMGEDGKMGAVAVKNAGGAVMIQDAETSVVWGMPGAVHEAGAYDAMGSIGQCGAILGAMTATTAAKGKVA